jgi:hypothetical protein
MWTAFSWNQLLAPESVEAGCSLPVALNTHHDIKAYLDDSMFQQGPLLLVEPL